MAKNRLKTYHPQAWQNYLREQQFAALAKITVPHFLPKDLCPPPAPPLLGIDPDPALTRAVVADIITRSEAAMRKRK